MIATTDNMFHESTYYRLSGPFAVLLGAQRELVPTLKSRPCNIQSFATDTTSRTSETGQTDRTS